MQETATPLPSTATLSPGFTPHNLCPRTVQASGSTNDPSSKLTMSGRRKVPRSTLIAGRRTSSANPPGSNCVVCSVSQTVWRSVRQ